MPAHQAPKQVTYRVRNWKQYNDALVRRGSLTLWVERDTLEAWQYQDRPSRGLNSSTATRPSSAC
jgi:hypothetical protein